MTDSSPRLGLAVPLLNEEALVADVTGRILEAVGEVSVVLALVNNGSADRTGQIVEDLADLDPRILPVHLHPNAGYGGGILAGLRALVAKRDPRVLGWAWGDGQVDPAVIPKLLAACEGGAMLAKARRVRRQDGLQRQLITATYAAVTRGLGLRTRDVNGCPKLLRREAFQTLALSSTDWFLDAEAVLGAEARGWVIAEEPVTMAPRLAGESKVGWRTVGEFARNLARWRLG